MSGHTTIVIGVTYLNLCWLFHAYTHKSCLKAAPRSIPKLNHSRPLRSTHHPVKRIHIRGPKQYIEQEMSYTFVPRSHLLCVGPNIHGDISIWIIYFHTFTIFHIYYRTNVGIHFHNGFSRYSKNRYQHGLTTKPRKLGANLDPSFWRCEQWYILNRDLKYLYIFSSHLIIHIFVEK